VGYWFSLVEYIVQQHCRRLLNCQLDGLHVLWFTRIIINKGSIMFSDIKELFEML
jgi:hypothetical protein